MSTSFDETGEVPEAMLQVSAPEIVIEAVRKQVQPLFGNELIDRVVLSLLFLVIVLAITSIMFFTKRVRKEELYLRSMVPRLPARVIAANCHSRMEFEVMLDDDDDDSDEDDEYFYDVSSIYSGDSDEDEDHVYDGYLDDGRYSTMSLRDRTVTSSFFFMKPSENKLT